MTPLPRATWSGTDLLSPRGGVSELLVSWHVGRHYYMVMHGEAYRLGTDLSSPPNFPRFCI